MKNILATITALILVSLLPQCGNSPQNPHPQVKPGESNGHEAQQGEIKIPMKDGKVDVDKLDVPDRMKDAIKEGRITKERLKEILERRKGRQNTPIVEVQPVNRKKINAFLTLNGTVEPERTVEVYSRLAAYVKKIIHEEGDFVKKDETLALLDDTEISISYRQAKIQLEEATLTLQDAKTNLARNKQLFETKMISEQEYQTAQSNFGKAKLDFQTKSESFKDLGLQLNYTKIKSPVQGYVTERSIEVGSRVTSGQQVFLVEDFSPLLVKVFVPTTDIINLKKNMEARISTDVLRGVTFNGKVKLINPRIDVQSGTVKVTVEVYDKTGKLKPGMFVETRILIRNNPNALVIPKKSVLFKENKTYVFVFKRMQVHKRLIETGITEGDDIEVTKGLEEGERVVTLGVEGLKDKMNVKFAPGAAPFNGMMGDRSGANRDGKFGKPENKPGFSPEGKSEKNPETKGDRPEQHSDETR